MTAVWTPSTPLPGGSQYFQLSLSLKKGINNNIKIVPLLSFFLTERPQTMTVD
jgi:hypothetical protein